MYIIYRCDLDDWMTSSKPNYLLNHLSYAFLMKVCAKLWQSIHLPEYAVILELLELSSQSEWWRNCLCDHIAFPSIKGIFQSQPALCFGMVLERTFDIAGTRLLRKWSNIYFWAFLVLVTRKGGRYAKWQNMQF